MISSQWNDDSFRIASCRVIEAAASVDDLHSLWQQWKSIIERNPDKRLIMDAFARRKAELMGRKEI